MAHQGIEQLSLLCVLTIPVGLKEITMLDFPRWCPGVSWRGNMCSESEWNEIERSCILNGRMNSELLECFRMIVDEMILKWNGTKKK